MQRDLTTKEKILNKVAAFFQKYRIVLLILLAATFVLFLALGIILEVNDKKINKATDYLYSLVISEDYKNWQSNSEAERKAIVDNITADFWKVEEKYPNTYPAQNAVFIQAESYYDVKEYAKAIEYYNKLLSSYKNSIFAPVSLYNIAAANEELGKNEKALKAYLKLADNYADASVLVPHALLNAARINITLGNKSEAEVLLTRIKDDYPDSKWTNLTNTSIIQIEN